jgi:hypothetical protein
MAKHPGTAGEFLGPDALRAPPRSGRRPGANGFRGSSSNIAWIGRGVGIANRGRDRGSRSTSPWTETPSDRLARIHPRGAEVVQQRYYAGLSLQETADLLGVSTKKVQRDWLAARAWLRKEVARDLGI